MFKKVIPDDTEHANGIFQEVRDNRTHADVHLQFDAVSGSQTFEGVSFSMSGFRVQVRAYRLNSTWAQVGVDEIWIGRVQDFKLRIHLSGFVCELNASGRCVSNEQAGNKRLLSFEFVELDKSEREALRRIVRSYLSGYIASPHDIAGASDPATEDAPRTESDKAAVRRRRRLGNYLGLGASGAALLGALVLVGGSLYEHFFVIRASFATVTAPRLDIISPAVGQIRAVHGGRGTEVLRDNLLYRINSDSLNADIELAQAKANYYTALAETGSVLNSVAGAVSPQIDDVMTASLPTDVGSAASAFSPSTSIIPTVPRLSSDQTQLREEANLARGMLNSLELRLAELSGYSPCDCLVAWAQEDGAWVKEGDTVLTLARTGPGSLRVEALIKLKYANDLHVGQKAIIELPETGETIDAFIDQIALDPTRQPRFGFPEWLRHEPTLASVVLRTDATLDAGLIGTPIKVALALPVGLPSIFNAIWGSNESTTEQAREPVAGADAFAQPATN